MQMAKMYESDIEEMAIEELITIGYQYVSGADIAPGTLAAERENYSEVLLRSRVIQSMKKLNPNMPYKAILDAYKKLSDYIYSDVVDANEKFHKMLIEVVNVQYRDDNEVRGDIVKICDFDTPENNEFLAVNQFTIVEKENNKRPDIILFINGIPIVLFELKNAVDENATIKKAYDQVEAYKGTIPTLFKYNEINIISDGLEAKAGSLTASFSRYNSWKTKDGVNEADKYADELSTLIVGLRLLTKDASCKRMDCRTYDWFKTNVEFC